MQANKATLRHRQQQDVASYNDPVSQFPSRPCLESYHTPNNLHVYILTIHDHRPKHITQYALILHRLRSSGWPECSNGYQATQQYRLCHGRRHPYQLRRTDSSYNYNNNLLHADRDGRCHHDLKGLRYTNCGHSAAQVHCHTGKLND